MDTRNTLGGMTRRVGLKGIGATAGTAFFAPFLRNLSLAAQGAPIPKRFVFVVKSSGIDKQNLVPGGVEVDFERGVERPNLVQVPLRGRALPEILEPFEAMRDQLTVIQGLSGHNLMGNHTAGYGALSCRRSEKVPVAPTLDYLLGAKHSHGPYPMYGMAIGEKLLTTSQPIADSYCYPNISAVRKGLAVPFQGSPAKAYMEFFGSAVLGAAESKKRMTLQSNLMDFLGDDARRIRRELGAEERERFEIYLDALESLRVRGERKAAMSETIQTYAPEFSDRYQSPIETVRQEAQFDIAGAALLSGLTNVVTLRVDTFGVKYSGLGIKSTNLHQLGHNQLADNGWTAVKARREIEGHHLRLIAKLASRLKTIPEAGGTMLDNTLIVYFSCAGGAHHAGQRDWPFVLVGGTGGEIRMGNYLQYPTYQQKGHKSVANLYMNILDAAGVDYGDHYGEIDAGLRDFDLNGALSELM